MKSLRDLIPQLALATGDDSQFGWPDGLEMR